MIRTMTTMLHDNNFTIVSVILELIKKWIYLISKVSITYKINVWDNIYELQTAYRI